MIEALFNQPNYLAAKTGLDVVELRQRAIQQNIANLEADMRSLVPQILDKPVEAMQLDLEMLVRAYDPCISCSVHVLKLD